MNQNKFILIAVTVFLVSIVTLKCNVIGEVQAQSYPDCVWTLVRVKVPKKGFINSEACWCKFQGKRMWAPDRVCEGLTAIELKLQESEQLERLIYDSSPH